MVLASHAAVRFPWEMLALKLLVIGAILGPIGDAVHVLTGTTSYPPHYAFFLGPVPWWVPPFFGSAAMSIGLGHANGPGEAPRPGSRTAALAWGGALAFVAHYCLSGILPPSLGIAKDLILAALAIGAWFAWERTLIGAILAIATAGIGVGVEATLVAREVFRYEPGSDQLFGVASWLPWLYVFASVGVGNLARYLKASA